MLPENEQDLPERREKFCQEYLLDLNGTKAAIRAGYAESGAATEAWRLLRNAEIQKRIGELRAEQAKVFDITKARVLQEYSRIAFANIKELYTVDGALKNLHDIDEESLSAIASLEIYEERQKSDDPDDEMLVGIVKKLKLWDKTKALEAIAKIQGYFAPSKVALTDPDGNPVTIFQLPDNGRGKETA
jgi:phage terminase small subunit